MRPGRLDRILYVSPPNLQARGDIFRLNFKKMAVHDAVDAEDLAQMVSRPRTLNRMPTDPPSQTEGCSGAEIASICQDAALSAMNEDMNTPSVSFSSVLLIGGLLRAPTSC